MRTEISSIPRSVANAFVELGAERGGQAVCVVVMLAGEIEFVWPSELDEQQITDCERAIVEALVEGWADPA